MPWVANWDVVGKEYSVCCTNVAKKGYILCLHKILQPISTYLNCTLKGFS